MTPTAAALATLSEKLKDDLAHADRHVASLQTLPSLVATGYEGLAAKEIPGVRAAILPTSDVVDGLRRFRHRVRKRYDDELDPSLLDGVISSTVENWAEIRTSLMTFVRFVDDCAAQASEPLKK
jgi:hypothetical protein